jgi:membrane associated rhomboid family serine protease
MGTMWRHPGGGGYGRRSLLTPAIKALLIANVAIFLFQTMVKLLAGPEAEYRLIQWLGLVPHGVTHGLRIWQPFTYLFLHGGIWHILINMFVLWMFGSDLERTWGRRAFLRYYFLTGVGAGVLNIIVKSIVDFGGAGPAMIPTIGASGAVYGVLLAAALVFPDRQVWLIPFPLMLPMRVYVFIIGALAFFGSLGASGDNISHVSHLGGMLAGYLYLRRGSYFFGLRNRYSDWRRRRLRRKFEVYQRRHRDDPPRRPGDWVN